jgi:hypothetical protein
MKPRHAAAPALILAWLLLIPPSVFRDGEDGSSDPVWGRPATKVHIAHWTLLAGYHLPYNTLAACEADRQKLGEEFLGGPNNRPALVNKRTNKLFIFRSVQLTSSAAARGMGRELALRGQTLG